MAATDSTQFPPKNQAFRFHGLIRSSATQNPLTGGLTGLAATISKDGGNFASTTNAPAEIQTSGVFYVDLTATEMNADSVVVKIAASNTSAITQTVVITTAHLAEFTGSARSQTVLRLEQFVLQSWNRWFNRRTQSRADGSYTQYQSDGTTVEVTGTATPTADTIDVSNLS